jgi:hypothetical protein
MIKKFGYRFMIKKSKNTKIKKYKASKFVIGTIKPDSAHQRLRRGSRRLQNISQRLRNGIFRFANSQESQNIVWSFENVGNISMKIG